MSLRITDTGLNRQMLADLQRTQSTIAETQLQIGSGSRINKPSDDPGAIARLVDIESTQSRLDQYTRNADAAESRLVLEETAMASAIETLSRLRELAVQANNDTMDDAGRTAIATEITERLGELYEAANARDAAGEYLFAGTQGSVRPFSPGNLNAWNGNEVPRELPITLNRTVKSGDFGADAFLRVPAGNGTFAVSSNPGNTGSGVIDAGSLNDSASFTAHDYEILFTTANTYDVVDLDTGTTVIAGATYTAEESIIFDGIDTYIKGVPAAGDSFQIVSGEQKDIFSATSSFIDALNQPFTNATERASTRQLIDNALSSFNQSLESLSTVRSRIGARLQIIETSRNENDAVNIQLAHTRSDLQDTDITEAVVRLENQSTTLELLYKSFERVDSLSLFDYL